MTFEWTPVTKCLPNKTKKATEVYYLATVIAEDGTMDVIETNWGPVDPYRLELFKDSPVYKKYIFDGWAFGDLWSSGIDSADSVIAWAYMPEPYMDEKRRDSKLVSIRDVELALLEKGQYSKRYRLGETWELNFHEIREALETLVQSNEEKENEERN